MFGGGKGSTSRNQVRKIKLNSKRSRAAMALALGVVVAKMSPVAHAGNTWTGTTSQDWNLAANWGGAFPAAGNNVTTINTATGNYPIITVTPTWATPYDISIGATAAGRLDQTGGTLSTGNGNWLFVGNGATGTFNLANTSTTGGTLTTYGQGTGSVTVGGSTANAGRLVVGQSNSAGTVNMNTTGTITMSDSNIGLLLGNGGTSSGTFLLDSGTVQINSNASTGIGMLVGTNNTAHGTFHMSNGTVNNTGGLWVGDNATGAVGTVTVDGGTFNSTGSATVGSGTSGQVFIGHNLGTGTFTETGGTVNFTGGTNIGFTNTATSGTTGTLNITGGTFLDTGEMRVGSAQNSNTVNAVGSGFFNVSGGTATVTSIIKFASANDNGDVVNGTGTVSGTGTLNDQGDLVLGYAGNADTGKMTVSGSGILNVGTNNALKWLIVGQYDTANGDLEITGGSVNLWNNSAIRFSTGNNNGTNIVNQTGGTVTFYSNQGTTVGGTGVLDMEQGSGTTQNNTYNLSGGTLIVPQIIAAVSNGTRTFNFNGGTLEPTASTASFMSLGTGTALANVEAGGALINTNGFNVTIAQPLIHLASLGATLDGGLTKSGSGTLSLTGANTYTGPTNDNAGTLAFSTAQSNIGAISVANSANLSTKLVSGTANLINAAGNVTLGTNALTFDFSNLNPSATTSFISMSAGTLTTGGSGSLSVNFLNTGQLTNGTYRLIDYPTATSILGGGITAFPSTPFTLGTRATGTIINSVTDTAVELSVTTDSLVWSGAKGDSSWVTATTGDNSNAGNWALKAGQTATNFWAGDSVEFNDTYNVGGGPVAPVTSTVNINGGADVSPTKVTFNNNSVSYTINGPNGITGTSTLNKLGTGTVTISSPNSYSGGTTMNAGTLNINGTTALGTGTVTIAGGTIDSTTAGIVLSNNNVQSWTGDFTYTGTNALDMGTGNVTLNGAASTENLTLTASTLKIGELLDGGTHGLNLTGTGTLVLTSVFNTGGSVINGTLTVGSGNTLQFNRGVGTGNAADGDFHVGGLAGSGTILNGANEARWLFVTNTADNTFSGTLANGGTGGLGLNKNGAGALTLTGTLGYTDVTTLNAGKLVIGIPNSGAGTNTIVNGGTLVLGNTAALGTATNIQFPNASTGTLDIALNSGSDIPYTIGSNTTSNFTIQSDVATVNGAGVTHTLTGTDILGAGSMTVQAGPNVSGGAPALSFLGTLVINSSTAGATTTLIPTTAGLTISAVSNTNGLAHTLDLDGTRTDSTVTGVISSASGALSVSKTNSGTWTLSASNTYTGTTIVNGGTLKITGGTDGTTTADIQIANAAGTTGTFDLESGTVTSQRFVISGNSANTNGSGGTATVIQNGGIINSAQWFTVGSEGPGTYTLNTGTLNVNSATGTQLEVGTFGTVAGISTMNVNGGNINLLNNANLTLGAGNTSQNAVVNQNSGSNITFYSNAGTTIGGTGALILGSGANPTGNYTYNLNGGTITTPSVTKATAGAAVGVLDLNGGTLRAAGNSTTFINGLTSAIVQAGGAIIDDAGHTITIPQALVHDSNLGATLDGGLTKNGSGTMTLTGSSTYTGGTTIAAGTVALSGTGSINGSASIAVNGGSKFVQTSSVAVSPTVTVNSGTLDGTGTVNTAIITNSASNILTNGNGGSSPLTVNNLTANGAAAFNLRISGTTPAIPVVNAPNLTISNSTNAVTININNAALAYNTLNGDGTYDLISYTTGTGVGPSGFTLAPVSGLSARQSASLVFPTGFVALQITGVNPVWTGLGNGIWTTADQTPNYNWVANGGTNFMHGDIVTFDDTATGTTNVVINDVNVDPSTILFNNSMKNYTVSGSLGITDYNSTPTPLVKSGTGSLTISSTNSYSGGTTLNAGTLNINSATAIGTGPLIINGGTIDNTSSGAVTLTTNNIQTWNTPTITFGGTNSLNMGTGTVALSGTNTTTTITTVGTGTLTVGGLTGSGDAVTKAGPGTLVVAGSSTYNGITTVTAGTLSVTGSIVPATATSVVGNTTTNAILNIAGGNAAFGYTAGGQFSSSLSVGTVAGATGDVQMSSGSFSTGQQLLLGTGQGGYAAYSQTGGAATFGSYIVVGSAGDNAVFNQSGGTVQMSNNLITLANGGSTTSYGVANISGTATFTSTATTGYGPTLGGIFVGEFGTGILNVSGSAVMNLSGWGLRVGHNTGATGIANLDGGTVNTTSISGGAGTSTVNFNGGAVTATAANTAFITTLTNAYVWNGGLALSNGGNNITVVQPLIAPTGSGVTNTGLVVSGSGFIDTPVIKVTGGGGTGATAVANLDGSGNLTGVTITNPGVGYTSAPSFAVVGGGGSGSVTGSAALATNTGGGVTFRGAGVTTLTGTNSYSGATTISAGTVRLGTGATPANLVAGYSFDNTTATPVQPDSTAQFTIHSSVNFVSSTSGTSLDGTANSNFSSGVTVASGGPSNFNGGNGNSLHFDGTGGFVNIVNSITDLSGTGHWTVSFWEQTVATGSPNSQGGAFLSKDTDGNWNAGNSIFYMGDGNGTGAGTYPSAVRNSGGFLSTNTNVADGTWKMVTFVGNNGTRSIYVNGLLTTPSQAGFNNTDIGDLVQLGYTPDTVAGDGTNPLYGNLDDINFYNGALTQAQITSLYNTNQITLPAISTNYLRATTPVNITTSGATLDLYGSAQRIGSLTGPAGTTVALGGGTLYVGGNNSSTTFAGNVTDAGSASTSFGGNLVKEGTGTLTLSGTNAYSGLTVVQAGTLAAGSATALAPNSTVIVNGGTLDTHLFANTISGLTVGSGGTLDLGVGNLLTSTGVANFAGTLNVSGAASGSLIDLMNYTGESGMFSVSNIPGGYTLQYNPTQLDLIISAGAANLVFTGYTGSTSSSNWDTATTNFVPLAGGSPVAYSDTNHDNVTFDDTTGNGGHNTLAPPTTITIQGGGVSPTSVTVTGTTNYIFTGGSIGGSATLTKSGSGSLTLTNTNTYTGATNVTGGTLNIESTAALPTASALSLSSGAKVIVNRNGGGRITLDLASLSNSGLIDLQNNNMVIHNANSTIAGTVAGELSSGFNTGGWNGTTGIISSTAQNSPLYTLGEALVGTNLTVAYTYYGDANLSGTIDGTDYSMIDANNGLTSGGTWQTGDFNYDGHVDGSDYSLIDNAFNTQNGNALALSQVAVNTSEIAGGSAAVPEPATLSLFGIAATALLGRRRRRHRM
jgi:fibronectin-binding autotransporter adhesin